jgi:hypothetical protein
MRCLVKLSIRHIRETGEESMTTAKTHRRWLIGPLGEKLGIKNEIVLDWGIVKPWVDMKNGQSEIHISYY